MAHAGTDLQLNLSLYGGRAHFNRTMAPPDGFTVGGRVGLGLFRYFFVEGSLGTVAGDSELDPSSSFPVTTYGFDVGAQFLPDSWINPYIAVGWAQLNVSEEIDGGLTLPLAGRELAAGFRIALSDDQPRRLDLRLDARTVWASNDQLLPEVGEVKKHFFFTAGITLNLFGGGGSDLDGDGVTDENDRCPDTPLGSEVDPFGCPLDYDADGVFDGLDACPFTPVGAVVDSLGCPVDGDGDGVFDGIDYCPDTPAGVGVDDRGCALDSDGDGVFDGIDQCPGTARGVRTDERGCPLPMGARSMERTLLDVGTLHVPGLDFTPRTATIPDAAKTGLQEIGGILERRPEIRLEVVGYADSSEGTPEEVQDLSERRAQAVRRYLTGNFRVDSGRIAVRGQEPEAAAAGNRNAVIRLDASDPGR